MTRFAIRISSLFAAPLLLIGVTRTNSDVTLEHDELVVRYGVFNYRVPLANVISAEPMTWRWYYGLGLRLIPGPAVGCVASSEGVVRLSFSQPLVGKIAGVFGIAYNGMAISLEDPQAFIDAVNTHIADKAV